MTILIQAFIVQLLTVYVFAAVFNCRLSLIGHFNHPLSFCYEMIISKLLRNIVKKLCEDYVIAAFIILVKNF